MGNCTSIGDVEPQTAVLVDADGSRRQINLPITAAEVMLDDPGHVVSPALQIRRNRRITAMKADEELSAGSVYLLVPTSKAHAKISESDIALIDSACNAKRPKRRSSKVRPTETEEGSGEKVQVSLTFLHGNGNGNGNDTGLASKRLASVVGQWRPSLEPICEGI